ncbi:glycosyltransferase family 4 protein, partial [Thermoproteota archaeon]
MKILMLNYEYPPLGGGAGNATYYLLKELSSYQDITIDLVTSSVGAYQEENISSLIKVYSLDIGKKEKRIHYQTNLDLFSYSHKCHSFCKKLLSKNPYDLSHAFFGIPCGFIASRFNIPYIVSLRGSDVPFFNERFDLLDRVLFQKLSRKIWRESKGVIANSQGLKDLACQASPEQTMSVIHNGVDCNDFLPLNDKAQSERIQLISVGRLIDRKGHEYLIESLRDNNEFQLTIIGDGKKRDELQNLARDLNAPVLFLGYQKHQQIKKHLQSSDVFISASLNEGMSNSLLEAMACGLAVVTTDVGGSKELVSGNGYVVKKGSPDAIHKALDNYKKDRMLIARHGSVSRKLALQTTWKKAAEEYVK